MEAEGWVEQVAWYRPVLALEKNSPECLMAFDKVVQ